MYLFGGFGVGSGLICLLLKETKGEDVSDTTEQERRKSLQLEREEEETSVNLKLSDEKEMEEICVKPEHLIE